MKNSDTFKFKQFEVNQIHSAMKVGTDGVILGAWCSLLPCDRRILDIGTGTGLLALMLAQRIVKMETADGSEMHIDAIEIEPAAAAEAQGNALRSPWADKIAVHACSLQDFTAEFLDNTISVSVNKSADYSSKFDSLGYDLIISNPPFFISSSICNQAARAAARHAELLPHEDLINGVTTLLAPGGRFVAIFPPRESESFTHRAARAGLFCIRKLNIYAMPGRDVIRVISEFSRTPLPDSQKDVPLQTLTITQGVDMPYTEQYRTLTRDFYIRH